MFWILYSLKKKPDTIENFTMASIAPRKNILTSDSNGNILEWSIKEILDKLAAVEANVQSKVTSFETRINTIITTFKTTIQRSVDNKLDNNAYVYVMDSNAGRRSLVRQDGNPVGDGKIKIYHGAFCGGKTKKNEQKWYLRRA
jgi:hypothetical protein